MNDEQLTLQDCLFRRVGELHSHLCRYDVYLRCLVGLLTQEQVLRDASESGSLEQRVETVERLLKARALPDNIGAQFSDIHAEMRPILQRQAISAQNPVLRAHIDIALPPDLSMPRPRTRSWLDPPVSPTAEEMTQSLALVERDILSAVKLYLQIATLTTRIERHMNGRPVARHLVLLQR